MIESAFEKRRWNINQTLQVSKQLSDSREVHEKKPQAYKRVNPLEVLARLAIGRVVDKPQA